MNSVGVDVDVELGRLGVGLDVPVQPISDRSALEAVHLQAGDGGSGDAVLAHAGREHWHSGSHAQTAVQAELVEGHCDHWVAHHVGTGQCSWERGCQAGDTDEDRGLGRGQLVIDEGLEIFRVAVRRTGVVLHEPRADIQIGAELVVDARHLRLLDDRQVGILAAHDDVDHGISLSVVNFVRVSDLTLRVILSENYLIG